jgi:hypothetical protein
MTFQIDGPNPAEVAISLARAGTPVFPCVAGEKRPLSPHGFRDATIEAAQVREWWERWPEANVAMPTGRWVGLVTYDVLDVDVRKSGSGLPALKILRGLGLVCGAAALVRTPSGGYHLYYEPSVQRSGRMVGHFLDFKARGGYVLVPPSLAGSPTASPYVLLEARPLGRSLDWEAVRRALGAVPADDRRRGAYGGSGAALARYVRGLAEGERNRGLFWAACEALRCGFPELAVLREAALQTGLQAGEVDRCLASAARTTSSS